MLTKKLGQSRNYCWLVMPIEELKIILSHDFNVVALQNMDQPTSSDSSATFVDQNNVYPRNDFPMQEWNIIPGLSAASTNSDIRIPQNMYPLNDSPMPDFIALLDELVSTPDSTEPQKAAPAGRSESQFFLFCYLGYIH